MLDPDDVDLDELAEALDDHSADDTYGHSWWLDPGTGEVRLHTADVDDETTDDLEEAGLVPVEALPSSVGYADMEDFVELVTDRRARDLLERAIEGRGAFRRFKDTLYEFPELRQRWFAFRNSRARHHAIEWLVDEGLITEDRAREAIAADPQPSIETGHSAMSSAIAADLRELYGERLVTVRVFGSRARDDAGPEADLDLLVVLDGDVEPWTEHRKMDELLWAHTWRTGIVVSALPVARSRFDDPDEPVLLRARAESVPA